MPNCAALELAVLPTMLHCFTKTLSVPCGVFCFEHPYVPYRQAATAAAEEGVRVAKEEAAAAQREVEELKRQIAETGACMRWCHP